MRSISQSLSIAAALSVDDLPAVAEHGHRVGHSQHVVEEMRDEDDAAALVAQAAQHGEQPLDLRRRQRRGRLVQDDDPRAGEQHAGELDQLLQADRQPAHAAAADRRRCRGARAARRPRAPSRASRTRPAALVGWCRGTRSRRRVRSGTMRQLLVHHADAGGQRVARRAEAHRPPVEPHLARVVRMHAGDDLHQRATCRRRSRRPGRGSRRRRARNRRRAAPRRRRRLLRDRRSARGCGGPRSPSLASRHDPAQIRKCFSIHSMPGGVGLGDDRAVGDDVLRDAAGPVFSPASTAATPATIGAAMDAAGRVAHGGEHAAVDRPPGSPAAWRRRRRSGSRCGRAPS